MKRDELGDLLAFLAVAEARSFTRAAAQLGTSQSSVSAVVKRLEERLDVRLLTRNTRTVTPTEAGQRLADTLRPAFDGIEDQLAELDEARRRPAGNLRITSSKFAARALLMPAVDRLLARYPGINVEIDVDHRLVDIIKEGYDAGVRLGERIDRDMIALPISGDMRMAVVGSPEYFKGRTPPRTPQDLTDHLCINNRMPTMGGLYAWEFEKDGRPVNVRVDGQLTSNDTDIIVDACLRGRGLCALTEGSVIAPVAAGQLVRVLEDWCPPFPGFHLYYPSRRQSSPAFRLFLEALREGPRPTFAAVLAPRNR